MPEPVPADQRREVIPTDGLWRWLSRIEKLLERGVIAGETIAKTLQELAPEEEGQSDQQPNR